MREEAQMRKFSVLAGMMNELEESEEKEGIVTVWREDEKRKIEKVNVRENRKKDEIMR